MTVFSYIKAYWISNSIRFSMCLSRVRLDRRVKLLVDALIDELDCSRSFLLHVGPRATRRAVSLLVRLGRASEVCH